MKRSTAAKRTKAHLRRYLIDLLDNEKALLLPHSDGGLCKCLPTVRNRSACNHYCLNWPIGGFCYDFRLHVNNLKTFGGKLFWIKRLEKELDRWAEEEKT